MNPGDIITGHNGKYRIGEKIGAGGVGTVYKGIQIDTGHVVAIKVLHGERFEISATSEERMSNEIRLSCSLKSPHIVQGLDHGKADSGQHFLVLEWMPGGTLAAAAPTGAHDTAQVVRWTCQIIKGFNALRDNGVVHRDIKPNNILLDAHERAKISDLGVAKFTVPDIHLTMTGDHIGSVLYISPRQRKSPASATHRDDFYALCLTLYEIALGRRITINNTPLLSVEDRLRVPVELAMLIDGGMEDPEEWEKVADEMGRVLDLENEVMNPHYGGSTLSPHSAIAPLLDKLRRNRREKENEPKLALAILDAVERGLKSMNSKIWRLGLEVSYHQDLDPDPVIWLRIELSDELWDLMPDEIQEDWGRMYAYVILMPTNEGESDHTSGAEYQIGDSGKRLYASHEYIDEAIYDEKFNGFLSERQLAALAEYGEGLALGAIVSLLKSSVTLHDD